MSSPHYLWNITGRVLTWVRCWPEANAQIEKNELGLTAANRQEQTFFKYDFGKLQVWTHQK